MAFKGLDRMKKAMDKVQNLQDKDQNETVEVDNKKKPVKVIKAGDMSSETKGSGSSEPDMKKGGAVKKYAKGGSVSSASKRADGCATKGKTKGRII